MAVKLGTTDINKVYLGSNDLSKIFFSEAQVFPIAGGATDPNFANVELLLHMDGSNGSTTFTDNSSNGLTITANGNAQVSTAQAKFDQSLLLDGTGDYLLITDGSSVTAPGTSDFTYELWFYAPDGDAQTNNGTLLTGSATGAPIIRYRSTGQLSFGRVGTGYQLSTTIPSQGAWHHVAVCRDSTSTRLYLDGTEAEYGTITDSYAATTHIGIHGGGSLYPWDGYIDDVRITIGVARYTGASITVPTAAFPDS